MPSFFASARGKFQSSFRDGMQKFIVWAPQEWLDLRAELLRVGSSFVRVERLAVLPDLDKGEVIDPRYLNIDLHAHRSLVFLSLRYILFQQFCSGGCFSWHDVHVGHYVNPVARRGFLSASPSRET